MARTVLMNKTLKTRINDSFLLVSVSISLIVTPALAADKQSPSPASQPNKTSAQKLQGQTEDEREYAAEYQFRVLKEPVSLPNLPAYTGQAKFLSGLSYPNVKDGATIGLRFAVREDPSAVLGWYKEAFRGYQWAYVPSDTGLTASKDGNSCTITVSKPSLVGYKADLEIGYKFAK